LTTIDITIDTQTLKVEAGSMIIQVADAAGIYIPRFCYHAQLSIVANCRMCLVEVERAPKPLPACATPVTEGMVIKTSSPIAVEAQKGTMEFLLINHPLDCPICDQGGECPLQDLAVGYGAGGSRFNEGKRAVKNINIGPLIETEMTRCIHCTRCVRCGQEIAGITEFGAIGRGEEMKITTFMEESVDSEVSGNVIDLCPVGALTSKPYRFTARSWEMASHQAISPHDSLGSNLIVQGVGGEVKRVLPQLNDAVNEDWLSDRDRFSYEAVNSSDRLMHPLLQRNGRMEQVSWEKALNVTVEKLREIVNRHGGKSLGALCTPTATLEEFYLLQKLMRGLGSENIDHRLRQQDFRDDIEAPMSPGSQVPVANLSNLSGALLVGCNIRKELPLVALRFRQLVKNGGCIATLNPMHFENNFSLQKSWITAPHHMPAALASVARELAKKRNIEIPTELETDTSVDLNLDSAPEIAEILNNESGETLLVLGQIAMQHLSAAELRMIGSWMALHCGVKIAILPDSNSAAGWIAGCIPHRGAGGVPVERFGRTAAMMTQEPLSACVLFGLEPDLDYSRPASLNRTLESADFVLSFSAFRSAAPSQANVILPIVPFTENSGSFLNLEGRLQFSHAAMHPKEEARPGWKILRVLGNMLGLEGFDYVNVKDVTSEVDIPKVDALYRSTPLLAKLKITPAQENRQMPGEAFERIFGVPIYSIDPVVRRATALQATRDNLLSAAYIHPSRLSELELDGDSLVMVRSAEGLVRLPVRADERVLKTCVYIPTARLETAPLGNSGIVWLDTDS